MILQNTNTYMYYYIFITYHCIYVKLHIYHTVYITLSQIFYYTRLAWYSIHSKAGSPGVATEKVQEGDVLRQGPGSTVTCSQSRSSHQYQLVFMLLPRGRPGTRNFLKTKIQNFSTFLLKTLNQALWSTLVYPHILGGEEFDFGTVPQP